MALDFPNSPSLNDTVELGGKTYQWDGVKWRMVYVITPTAQALAPTITEVSKTNNSITFTITNNDDTSAVILYEVGDATPDENSVELAASATSSNITVTGLTAETTYTVSATASVTGKVLSNVTSLAIETDPAPILGVQWDQSNSSPVLTRTDDAVGLTVSTADGYKTSDYDSFYPYSQIRRCNLADNGTVNAYYGDAGYTENGSNGQVMVEIPKFYYKHDVSGSVHNWRISESQLSGYSVHPMFVVDGVEKDKVYFSAFEGNGTTMQSIAGVSPDVSQNISTFRTRAQNRGTGWQQQTFTLTSGVQLLYLIEFANFNSQSAIGNGVTGAGAKINTGATANSSGQLIAQSYGTTANATTAMSYRGIENFFGNIWTFVDGLIITDSGYYYDDNSFNDTGSGFNLYSTSPITSDGYISNIINETSGFDFSFIASATSGSETTYLTDYQYSHNTGETNITFFGGAWVNGADAGCFYWDLNRVASYSLIYFGARLSYIG